MSSDWNNLILNLPKAHFLQTREWAAVKQQTGWQPFYLLWGRDAAGYHMYIWQADREIPSSISAAALVLQRTLPILGFAARLRVLYCPKGPLLDWSDELLRQTVLNDLERFAHRQSAIFLKIDPDVPLGYGIPGSSEDELDPLGRAVTEELSQRSWLFSKEQIQFRNTLLVDLSPEEELLLNRMKQKTRYNVRLAERKGVSIRLAGLSDLSLLYQMYAETSVRDGFVIRPAWYYEQAWRTFLQAGMAEALLAEVDGEPVAGLIFFHFAATAWYVYGMSRDQHRDKMPNYLLQWHAMRRARAAGCRIYDLWGAPNEFAETDPLWGVFRFKEGLGGRVVRNIGAWDFTVSPGLYHLYTRILPKLLDVLRKRGKTATRIELSI